MIIEFRDMYSDTNTNCIPLSKQLQYKHLRYLPLTRLTRSHALSSRRWWNRRGDSFVWGIQPARIPAAGARVVMPAGALGRVYWAAGGRQACLLHDIYFFLLPWEVLRRRRWTRRAAAGRARAGAAKAPTTKTLECYAGVEVRDTGDEVEAPFMSLSSKKYFVCWFIYS